MVADNYACAYKEVIEVLKYTKKEDVKKIPKQKIMFWINNMKKDYNFKIDVNKKIEEQNLSKEAKAIIANIFKNYWATDYQRKRIEEKERYEIENQKKEKYNINDIFDNKEQITTNNTNEEIKEYKESIFTKIINKIKSIFSR